MLPGIKQLNERSTGEKVSAAGNAAAHHARLRRCGRGFGCADCDSRATGWGLLPFGVNVCIDCAQIHRSLGTHISRVKAWSTGTYTWFEDEVRLMEQVGNDKGRAMYGAPARVSRTASHAARLRHIRDKYERLRWLDLAPLRAIRAAPSLLDAPCSAGLPAPIAPSTPATDFFASWA